MSYMAVDMELRWALFDRHCERNSVTLDTMSLGRLIYFFRVHDYLLRATPPLLTLRLGISGIPLFLGVGLPVKLCGYWYFMLTVKEIECVSLQVKALGPLCSTINIRS